MTRIALLALVLLTACAPQVASGGILVRRDEWRASQQELAYKAMADLGRCDVRTYMVLSALKRVPVRAVVQGCGSMGVYERQAYGRVSYKHAASWLLVSSGAECAPLPELRPECRYTHDSADGWRDPWRVFVACAGQPALIDVTDRLPRGYCPVP